MNTIHYVDILKIINILQDILTNGSVYVDIQVDEKTNRISFHPIPPNESKQPKTEKKKESSSPSVDDFSELI